VSIDATGITIKRLADIITDLGDRLKANLSPTINVGVDSVMGKIIGVFATELSLVHELAQQAYDSISPDQAEGRQLDNIGAIRGISRNAATFTTATILVNASSALSISAGNLTIETATGIQFENQGLVEPVSTVLATGSITFVGGSTRTVTRTSGSWALDGVVAGSKVTFSDTASNNYTGTVASVQSATQITLTSATTVTSEVSATPIATVFSASVVFGAVNAGVQAALSGTISTISTPVAGLNSVVNATDATPGTDTETDLEYRVRQEASLQQTGAGVDYAIRSALLGIDTIDQALVLSNRTDATVNGIPPHAFHTIIWPDVGDDEAIARVIFLRQPAGIQAFGSTTLTITDTQGEDQPVAFSYATAIPMYMTATITTDADFPANGNAQVAAALLAEGNGLNVGDDVKVWKFIGALDAIPGILTISIAVDITITPVATSNITIANTEIATFDSSRIVVTP
jgi:uncharacterized phage protein gp47/JayE